MSDNVIKALVSEENLKCILLSFIDSYYRENKEYPTAPDVFEAAERQMLNIIEHIAQGLIDEGWMEVVDSKATPIRYRTTKIDDAKTT
jgi:hypothetical protein